MFPTLEGDESLLVQSTDNPIPWTYKFDWEKRQFLQGLDGRYLKTKTYAEYLAETAKKILNTKRFQYAIYSDRYGVDFLADVGLMRSVIKLPEVRTEAEEALETHSEIERAEVTDISIVQNRIVFSVEIEGTRGTTKVEVDIWQR